MDSTDEQSYEDEMDKTDWNAAVAALMRIHEAKKWLDITTDIADKREYIKYLKMFYKELYCMMNKQEREIHVPKFNYTRALLKRINNNEVIDIKEWDKLEDWELELRDIDQIKEMNIPKRSDMRFAMAKR